MGGWQRVQGSEGLCCWSLTELKIVVGKLSPADSPAEGQS